MHKLKISKRILCCIILFFVAHLLIADHVEHIVASLIVQEKVLNTTDELEFSDFVFFERHDSFSYSSMMIKVKGYKETIFIVINNDDMTVFAMTGNRSVLLLQCHKGPPPFDSCMPTVTWVYEVMLWDSFNFINE